MKKFEVYPTDLTPEARARYVEAIGGEDEIQDFIPIAVLEFDETEEVGPFIVDVPLLDDIENGGEK